MTASPTSRIVLCPGQGAQFVGMGRAWAEKSSEASGVFEKADAVLGDRLGGPLSKLCFEGPVETLNRTDVSQPAIYVASVACWRGLLAKWGAGGETGGAGAREAGVVAAAGLSLGEYTALHLAGCFSFEDGLELVALRGRAMQDAAEAAQGGSGMVALIGADEAQAQQVCDKALAEGEDGEVLVCANFNAPGQVVISGSKGACGRAEKVAAEMGLRATALPVAGAFHSPLMAPAAERLRAALEKTPISPPRCTVVSNVTAKPHEMGEGAVRSIRQLLVEQLTSPVRWAESCANLAAGGANGTGAGGDGDRAAAAATQWIELAPGRTLSGLMRRIDRGVKVENHDEPTD